MLVLSKEKYMDTVDYVGSILAKRRLMKGHIFTFGRKCYLAGK